MVQFALFTSTTEVKQPVDLVFFIIYNAFCVFYFTIFVVKKEPAIPHEMIFFDWV